MSTLPKHQEDIIGLNVQYEKLLDKFKTAKENLQVKSGNTKSKNTKELLMTIKRTQEAEVIKETVMYLIERVQQGELPVSELLSLNISQFKACTSKQK